MSEQKQEASWEGQKAEKKEGAKRRGLVSGDLNDEARQRRSSDSDTGNQGGKERARMRQRAPRGGLWTRLDNGDPNDEVWRKSASESDTGHQDGKERAQKVRQVRGGESKGGRRKGEWDARTVNSEVGWEERASKQRKSEKHRERDGERGRKREPVSAGRGQGNCEGREDGEKERETWRKRQVESTTQSGCDKRKNKRAKVGERGKEWKRACTRANLGEEVVGKRERRSGACVGTEGREGEKHEEEKERGKN